MSSFPQGTQWKEEDTKHSGQAKAWSEFCGNLGRLLWTLQKQREEKQGHRDTKDGGGVKDWQQGAAASLIALRKDDHLEQQGRQSIAARLRVVSYNQQFWVSPIGKRWQPIPQTCPLQQTRRRLLQNLRTSPVSSFTLTTKTLISLLPNL